MDTRVFPHTIKIVSKKISYLWQPSMDSIKWQICFVQLVKLATIEMKKVESILIPSTFCKCCLCVTSSTFTFLRVSCIYQLRSTLRRCGCAVSPLSSCSCIIYRHTHTHIQRTLTILTRTYVVRAQYFRRCSILNA